jgi:hypothetical protein
MSRDEHPDDTALTQELRDSLSELAVPRRPPLAAIISRGRAYRRRRLAGIAGLGVTGAAAAIALALGLTGVFGATPAAAVTLTSYADGSVSLRLSQMFDPGALQRALAQHRIRALVKIGNYCSSTPAAPSPVGLGVLPGAGPGPAGTGRRATPGPARGQGIWESVTLPVKASQLAPVDDPISMVINPAAMPAGTELFIGYFDLTQTIVVDLIYTSSHTCRVTQQPPAPPPPPGLPPAH